MCTHKQQKTISNSTVAVPNTGEKNPDKKSSKKSVRPWVLTLMKKTTSPWGLADITAVQAKELEAATWAKEEVDAAVRAKEEAEAAVWVREEEAEAAAQAKEEADAAVRAKEEADMALQAREEKAIVKENGNEDKKVDRAVLVLTRVQVSPTHLVLSVPLLIPVPEGGFYAGCQRTQERSHASQKECSQDC